MCIRMIIFATRVFSYLLIAAGRFFRVIGCFFEILLYLICLIHLIAFFRALPLFFAKICEKQPVKFVRNHTNSTRKNP